MWIFAIITVLIILALFLSFMAKVAVRPTVHTLEYERNHLESMDMMQGESIHIDKEYTVESFDGYKLWAGLLEADPKGKHYVILSHGYTSTRYGTYKYAVLWKKMGFNCILYENRGHGVNKPATVTFGKVESRDLMSVIEDTFKRYGEDIHIGLHGESMGSGLQVMALQYKPKVDFIVNDCGYSAILPVLQWKVQQNFHMPKVLPILASPVAKLIYGLRFEEVRPIDWLKDNEVPICFVHGLDDTFTHTWHSEEMYKVNKGYKELHLFEGAEHAECVVKDTGRYERMLRAFVAKVYED